MIVMLSVTAIDVIEPSLSKPLRGATELMDGTNRGHFLHDRHRTLFVRHIAIVFLPRLPVSVQKVINTFISVWDFPVYRILAELYLRVVT